MLNAYFTRGWVVRGRLRWWGERKVTRRGHSEIDGGGSPNGTSICLPKLLAVIESMPGVGALLTRGVGCFPLRELRWWLDRCVVGCLAWLTTNESNKPPDSGRSQSVFVSLKGTGSALWRLSFILRICLYAIINTRT